MAGLVNRKKVEVIATATRVGMTVKIPTEDVVLNAGPKGPVHIVAVLNVDLKAPVHIVAVLNADLTRRRAGVIADHVAGKLGIQI